MIRKTAVFLALLVLVATGARAEEPGFYLGVNAGGNFVAGAMENRSSPGDFNFEYQPGYLASLALGYRLGADSIIGEGRVELELGYRTNPLDRIEFSDGKFDADGDATVVSLMLNAFGEYPGDGPLIPYLGVGIGAATLSLSGFELAGSPVIDDSATVFAYQLAVGVDYPLSESLVLDLGYRFFGTSDAELTDALGVAVKSEYQAHGLQVGLRF